MGSLVHIGSYTIPCLSLCRAIRPRWVCSFFFYKQKTAYEMRICDCSSDVCSSDLPPSHASTPEGPTAMQRGPPSMQATPDLPLDAADTGEPADTRQLGRAPCRERVCQYV